MSNNKNILYCSFCGKSQHEVRKLIAGPTVFICDECVELCMDIIKEESKDNFVKHQDGLPLPKEICKVLGVKDIVAKSMGTSNAHNVIRATMKALLKQNSPKQISSIRNKKISEIIEKRG